MKRLVRLVQFIAGWSLLSTLAVAGESAKQPVIDIRGPTVIAFFPPVTQAELEKDPDTNEALADFQVYARKVREPLRKAGIAFHELYAHSFRIRMGMKLTTFRPGKIEVGYYLVAPGKEARVEHGVLTDVDILEVANEYFGGTPKAHERPSQH